MKGGHFKRLRTPGKTWSVVTIDRWPRRRREAFRFAEWMAGMRPPTWYASRRRGRVTHWQRRKLRGMEVPAFLAGQLKLMPQRTCDVVPVADGMFRVAWRLDARPLLDSLGER